MAAPVWVLSVDLQAKTASFSTGLADAARSARGSFADIKNAASDMGDGMGRSSTNIRAGLGLVNAVIRGESTRAVADLIREYQSLSIVMAALPYAIGVAGFAAVVMIAHAAFEKIKEYREESEKLANSQTQFGTAVQDSFNSLDDKLLQAEKRTDELRNDHIGALHKELQLIDHASMADLVKEFEAIAKAADTAFKGLEGHWYTLGIGSAGASHALEQFKTQYDSLMSQGKDKEAGDLLAGTRESAQRVLDMQRQASSNQGQRTATGTTGDYSKVLQAETELKKAGVGYSEKEVQAQELLVSALNDQVAAEGKIADIKKADSANATTQTGNQAAAKASEAGKQAAASRQAIAEAQLAASKSLSDAQLTITNASAADRLAADMAFEQRDLDIKLAGNQQQIAALNRSGDDYNNELKALNEKAAEISAQSASKVASLQAQAQVEANRKAVTDLDTAQREQIAATQQGSAARVQVIAQALQVQYALGQQGSEMARSLAQQQVEATRQAAAEEAKLKAEAGKEAADNTSKMGQLQMAAQQEAQALQDSARRMTIQRRIAEEIQAAAQEFAIKQQALQQEAAALDASGNDYNNKLKAIQDKETQLVRQHEDQVTQIKNQAQMERNQKIQAAEQQYENMIASSLTRVIMGQTSFTAAMRSLGNQVVTDMLQQEIKHIEANLMSKGSDAAAAARKAYVVGASVGGPAGVVLGPVFAAAAFAGVMAFAGGTDAVPGVGRGDVVPAMLTPGEGVVPGGVMDGLRNVARNGGFDQKASTTVHAHFSPQVHAMDAEGVDRVLTKHQKVFQRHFQNTMRRMNK